MQSTLLLKFQRKDEITKRRENKLIAAQNHFGSFAPNLQTAILISIESETFGKFLGEFFLQIQGA